MPFEEAHAQTQLMNELTALADSVKSLILTNQLLQDSRYSDARGRLDVPVAQLAAAQFDIGKTPRLDG